jgi:hypothetical protein
MPTNIAARPAARLAGSLALLTLVLTLELGACSGAGGGQTFEGRYESSFEVSAFYPGDTGCRPGAEAYWLGADSGSGFFERYDALRSGQGVAGFAPFAVQTHFVGRLSPPGSYGHLGLYAREITVERLIEMQPAQPCP